MSPVPTDQKRPTQVRHTFSTAEVKEGLEKAAELSVFPGFRINHPIDLQNGKSFNPKIWLSNKMTQQAPIDESLWTVVGKFRHLEHLPDGTAIIVAKPGPDSSKTPYQKLPHPGPLRSRHPLSDTDIREGLEKAHEKRQTKPNFRLAEDILLQNGRRFNPEAWLSSAQQAGRAIPEELRPAVARFRNLEWSGPLMVIANSRRGQDSTAPTDAPSGQLTAAAAGARITAPVQPPPEPSDLLSPANAAMARIAPAAPPPPAPADRSATRPAAGGRAASPDPDVPVKRRR
ncbi:MULTISPECIES: hypothetical protein [Micromonospora]|uniref:Uncharacterized protein n=1 Tax=Micromonospora yangpuensis TaxID=683228 RepID=A0A1C6UYP5_9ACTN|nr:hypothetical protein [Micromonospora yangpuensis]GGL95438.1 hypothetical protein GCM10012279_11100 [Micromonospora yangpuensis]SCL59129.1 hypothetical protein GA0070617_4009 [Micromonospora yangpuensis]